MPVRGSHKSGAFWNGVIEKVQAKLSRWKGRCLSMAGRICLIRFVLSSIPLFFMSLFKLPSRGQGSWLRYKEIFSRDGVQKEGRSPGLPGTWLVSLVSSGG